MEFSMYVNIMVMFNKRISIFYVLKVVLKVYKDYFDVFLFFQDGVRRKGICIIICGIKYLLLLFVMLSN